MVDDASQLVSELRTAGGDRTWNLPGGGTIILGLDERNRFRPVRLDDPQTLKQGLATKARSFTPPVQLTISDAMVDGEPVVVAKVHECDPSTKPCRVSATGAAYLRGLPWGRAASPNSKPTWA